jgi:hypothetical protein
MVGTFIVDTIIGSSILFEARAADQRFILNAEFRFFT